MVFSTTVSPVLSHYFGSPEIDSPLSYYVQMGLEGLKSGEVCVQVSNEHKEYLKASPFVSVSTQDLTKPFVLTGDKLYFQRYLLYENQVFSKIQHLIESGKQKENERLNALRTHHTLISALFNGFEVLQNLSGKENVDWQRVAVINAFLKDFMVLTGGPGTGKTTTVSKLLALLFSQEPHLKVSLVAQTGKASTRLKESLDNSRKSLKLTPHVAAAFDKIEPSTIHRLLGYVKNSIDFKRDASNPLEADVVILDESSMVDLPMMAKLLSAIPLGTRVYFLGDLNQLSSVEVGSVFGDLCLSLGEEVNHFTAHASSCITEFYPQFKTENNPVKTADNTLTNHVVKLERSYRFSSVKGLGKFAHGLLSLSGVDAQFLSAYKKEINEEGVRIVATSGTAVENEFVAQYTAYIKEPDTLKALNQMNNVKVLCAVKEGTRGVFEMNKNIESFLLEEGVLKPEAVAYHNQPILILKNDYNIGLYNGDVGLIRTNEEGRSMAYFTNTASGDTNGLVSYEVSSLPSYQTAFAMTIHKSQGSEFKDVVLVLPEREHKVLSKQLIYTGVTRAKKRVLILASDDVFLSSVKRVEQRLSNLKDRF